MNTFDAIFTRRSVHHFLQERLEWDVISGILEYANNLPMLIEGISVEFKLVSNIESKQGFRSPFSIKAPYYLCISSEEKEDYLMNAGYLMQQLNLYIASKGFGACFVMTSPGFSLRSTMKYEYVTALAFGKADEPVFRDSFEAKRLPEQEVVVYKEEVNPDIKQVLTAARLAPSCYNTQPWRFVVYKKRVHVFAKKSVILSKAMNHYKMIDMGIMMANLLLAAEELWVDMTICKLENLQNKKFHNNQYIHTISLG